MPDTVHLTAVIVLNGAALAVLAWIVVALRRSPFTPVQSVLWFMCILLCRVLWRAEVIGDLPSDESKGAVVICNHRTSTDPFFIQSMLRRVSRWMVAKEYFEIPLVGWFLRACEAIPVSRGGVDTKATKIALRYASQGGYVGMLPEGRINTTSQFLLPGRPGAVLVALKSRVPILPCYIEDAPYDGTYWGCLFMPARVRVVIGKPYDLSQYFDRARDGELLKQITKDVMKEIAILAGRPDFEPQVAGRRWKPGT
ncbi:MAG: lysophospholipid acyltransferase family protein [Pirellulales bacterium]